MSCFRASCGVNECVYTVSTVIPPLYHASLGRPLLVCLLCTALVLATVCTVHLMTVKLGDDPCTLLSIGVDFTSLCGNGVVGGEPPLNASNMHACMHAILSSACMHACMHSGDTILSESCHLSGLRQTVHVGHNDGYDLLSSAYLLFWPTHSRQSSDEQEGQPVSISSSW